MYILASVFFKKTINTYLKLEICVACREFIAFKYVFILFFFPNKTDDYLYLYIRNLENSFVFVLAGRGYKYYCCSQMQIDYGPIKY